MKRKILLAAGGTGGHLFPAVAVAKELKARGHEVYLMIDRRAAAFQKDMAGISIIQMPLGPKGPGILGKIKFILSLLYSTLFAFVKIVPIRPKAIVAFGGYPSFPVLLASFYMSIPKILHEQNAYLGRVNQWFARAASYLALSFPNTKKIPNSVVGNTVVTGMPLRPAILKLADVPYVPPKKDGPFSILILGGSQGTQVFGEVIPKAIAELPEKLRKHLVITQQSRVGQAELVKEAYNKIGINATVAPFFDNVENLMAQAHLMICRAGSSSTWEIITAKRPTLFIPLPSAKDDHQTYNAEYAEKSGGAWVMHQSDLTPKKLSKFLEKLIEDPDMLREASQNLGKIAPQNATEKLVDLIESV